MRQRPHRAGFAVVAACLALGGTSMLELRHMSVTHGEPAPWALLAWITLPRWVLLAVTLPTVLYVGVPARPPRLRPRVVALHAALFLAIASLHAIVTAWATAIGSPVSLFFPWWARLLRAWYGAMPTMVSLYGAVLLAAWGLAEARERERRSLRASQLEAQLQAARLAALRAKLQPHFLYNTLTGIAALVADAQPAHALAALESLGELLHAALRDDDRAEIPLAEELALTERYLSLQRMRFGERLHYELCVPPTVADATVPMLLLQPLVENAVIHGLDAGTGRVTVRVEARRTPAGTELHVENDGAPLAASRSTDGTSGLGVGLAATRARLASMYGDRASLALMPREGGGARVIVVLPRAA